MDKLKLAKELAELYIRASKSKKIERITVELIRTALVDSKNHLTRAQKLKYNIWAEMEFRKVDNLCP